MAKKTLGRVRKTNRGFHIIEFTDHYGHPCSLQESSLAIYQQPGSSAVWLGCDKNSEIKHTDGEPVSPRMHLTYQQVKALVHHLNKWLEKGRL